jgi:pentapeptide repeat protein
VDLSGADLSGATLVETDLEGATLTGCRIYGISAWNVRLEGAIESNLVITRRDESPIQVDNLEMAQFLYLLLNNQKIRHVIDTITSKAVLILGRFTPERKAILDGIRDELRRRSYLPVLFDFEKPASRDLTETISTLAHMARFAIADITDAKSIPQELERIVPDLPSVPVQPLLLASQQEYGMFEHFRRYPWVLEPVLYDDQQKLLVELEGKVIVPAEAKAKQQTGR